jgi:signal transduction histidine kinase
MTLPVVASVVGALIVGRLSRRRRDPAPFLATVSHELRTPLHAIAGWVSLLKSGRLSEDETMRALDGIERNVRLEARLIDELLEASRLLSDRVTIALAPLDLRVPIEGAVARVASAAQTKNITLHVNLPESGVTVPGDERRLSDAVCHLLSNAIKFTPENGEVWIDLEVMGDQVCLRVADSGEGIAPEDLPRVFEPFLQGHTRTKREGLGLGLAVVRQLVELHHGKISAHSTGRGQGAVFRVTLPLISSRFGWHDTPKL